MKLKNAIPSLAAAVLAAVPIANAQNATTDPVGFVTFDLPVGSDTVISTPLAKQPTFTGSISTRSGFTVNLSGANLGSLTSTPHYLQAVSGSQAGMIFDIASNTSGSVTLIDNGVEPSGLVDGTQVVIIEYWTVGSVFPAEHRNVSFTPSSSTTSPARRTQILLPNINSTGINRASSTTLFFSSNSAEGFWRTTAAVNDNANGTPLLPDTYFIVRNPASAAAGLKLTVVGSVITNPITIPLDRVAGSANDNYVSMGRPMDIKIKDLGLISSGAFLPSNSTTAPARRDTLLVFNNSILGFNKAAAATYFFVGTPETGTWRSTAAINDDAGDTIIPAGSGIVIRKYGTNLSNDTLFWKNEVSLAQ